MITVFWRTGLSTLSGRKSIKTPTHLRQRHKIESSYIGIKCNWSTTVVVVVVVVVVLIATIVVAVIVVLIATIVVVVEITVVVIKYHRH